jgi:cAMP and cAMP-inhibited cGMP 3',5'-cyclic phosphodiesterase 10
MISMDTLIVQIMNQAQKLVDADRASLFLVDAKTNQLYARSYSTSQGTLRQYWKK